MLDWLIQSNSLQKVHKLFVAIENRRNNTRIHAGVTMLAVLSAGCLILPTLGFFGPDLYAEYVDDKVFNSTEEINLTKSYRTVGFYSVFTSGAAEDRHIEVIDEQNNHMKKSGLYNHLDSVYYSVIGGKDTTITDKKFKKLKYLDRGTHTHTFTHLYQHCRANPIDRVVYYYGKTSDDPNEYKHVGRTRRILNAFTLHPGCISALDEFDTCGWRLSPLPFVHYSGNFWWATCSYINTLIDPGLMFPGSLMQVISNRALETVVNRPSGCLGFDDFFAEGWIGSAPELKGADCLGNIYPFYMFGASFPNELSGLADIINEQPIKNQLICREAGTSGKVPDFKETFDKEFQQFQCANIVNFNYRSLLWYNEPANSLIGWRAKYGDKFPGEL